MISLLSVNGAAFGLEPVLTQSAWFRPHNRSEDVERLYLVGAGTHPGAGVPASFPPPAFSTPSFPTLPRSSRLRILRGADRAACRRMIRRGFKVVLGRRVLLLPAKVRDAAYALYAFCRLSDDLVDVERRHARTPSRSCVDRLASGLCRGAPRLLRRRAFADVVPEFGIPRALPEALIEGLEWDVRGVTLRGLSDVFAYAARVAGAVGAMMTVLMGVRTATSWRAPAILALRCS